MKIALIVDYIIGLLSNKENYINIEKMCYIFKFCSTCGKYLNTKTMCKADSKNVSGHRFFFLKKVTLNKDNVPI